MANSFNLSQVDFAAKLRREQLSTEVPINVNAAALNETVRSEGLENGKENLKNFAILAAVFTASTLSLATIHALGFAPAPDSAVEATLQPLLPFIFGGLGLACVSVRYLQQLINNRKERESNYTAAFQSLDAELGLKTIDATAALTKCSEILRLSHTRHDSGKAALAMLAIANCLPAGSRIRVLERLVGHPGLSECTLKGVQAAATTCAQELAPEEFCTAVPSFTRVMHVLATEAPSRIPIVSDWIDLGKWLTVGKCRPPTLGEPTDLIETIFKRHQELPMAQQYEVLNATLPLLHDSIALRENVIGVLNACAGLLSLRDTPT